MLERLGIPRALFGEVVPSGTRLGPLLAGVAADTGLNGVGVVVPAAHDTGSAVAGAPLRPGWAYISSGTWSLAASNEQGALVNEEVARHNFTNEGGAFGTTRFLKNVMGLWILESCRREWLERGASATMTTCSAGPGAIEGDTGLIFPDDARFLHPPSMLAAIADQMAESGQTMPAAPPAVAKVILDSLAHRYASVFSTIERLTPRPSTHPDHRRREPERVPEPGNGDRDGEAVLAGPVEATPSGTRRCRRSRRAASPRSPTPAHTSRATCGRPRSPEPTAASARAALRYAAIEARFTEGRTP